MIQLKTLQLVLRQAQIWGAQGLPPVWGVPNLRLFGKQLDHLLPTPRGDLFNIFDSFHNFLEISLPFSNINISIANLSKCNNSQELLVIVETATKLLDKLLIQGRFNHHSLSFPLKGEKN